MPVYQWGKNTSKGGKSSAGGSPTLTGFRTLTPANPVGKLNAKYNGTYIPQLQAVKSYHPNLAKQMYTYDLGRVKAGKNPLTSTQFINAYHALLHGQGVVTPKHSSGFSIGHFLSDAGSDLANLAGGLNPIRMIPSIIKEGEALANLPGNLSTGQTRVHDLADVLALPGIRDIPGAYTAHNIVTGDFAAIAQHPFSTVVDLLPYSHYITSTLAASRIAEAAKLPPEEGSVFAKNISEASTRVQDTTAHLANIEKEITDLKNANPNFDLLHANFTKAKLWKAINEQSLARQALDDAHSAYQATLTPEAIPAGSALEAAKEGKPLKAAFRASGASEKLSTFLERYGLDARTAEWSRFQALKLRGEALETQDAIAAWARQEKATAALHDLEQVVKDPAIKDINHAWGIKGQVTKALDEFHAAVADFQLQVRKEMVIRFGINYGTHVTELFPHPYIDSVDSEAIRAGDTSTLDNPQLKERFDSKGRLLDTKNEVIKGKTIRAAYAERGLVPLKDIAKAYNLSTSDIAKLEAAYGDLNHIGVPKFLERGVKLGSKLEENALATDMKKISQIYRYSIVMRPQHVIHISALNVLATTLYSGVTPYAHVADAVDLMKGDWPRGLPHVSVFDSPADKVTSLMAVGQGKSLFRILRDSMVGRGIAGYAHVSRRIEESINNLFAAMNYLKGAAKGLTDYQLSRLEPIYSRWGMSDIGAEHVAGLEAVRKITISMDEMTPIERQVIRSVFPFYPYMKFLMKFLARFPQDHPVRASLLASIGRNEMTDFGTGLPTKFMDFFPIGSMDANGNQQMLDAKSLNPFRALNGYNPFTLAGFISSLNPAIQAPITLAGVNVTTATPELFPQLKVDPRTGAFVAVHSGTLPSLLETFLPPLASVDNILQLTSNYKQLAANGGSEAQWKAIAGALGITFGFPQNINLFQERVKFAQKQYSVAAAEETAAMKSGQAPSDTTAVPVRGQFLTQDQFQQLLDSARRVQKSQGTNAPLTKYIG